MKKIADFTKTNFAKIFIAALILGLIFGGIFLAMLNNFVRAATYQTLIAETFTGNSTTANRWNVGGTDGAQACLTAGDANTPATSVKACDASIDDPLGTGALRLTNADAGKSGFIFLDTPLNLGDGLDVTFEMFTYGGATYTGKTGDGMSFFFFDGTANPDYANPGNALGYIGLQSGYAGVGFDTFGNFWVNKCQGAEIECYPNTIGVKGDFANGNQNVGTPYTPPVPLSIATNNREAAKKTVHVLISQDKQMLVEVDYNDGNGFIVAQQIDLTKVNPGTPPATLKIGFAASTGGATDIHEIRNLTIKQLAPRLSISTSIANNQTEVATGENFTLNLHIENNPAARNANLADVVAQYDVPENLEIANLPANCSAENPRIVLCKLPATDGGLLAGASRDFQIVLTAKTAGNVNNSASVFGGGDPDCASAGICASSAPIRVFVGACKYNPAILSNDENCVPACEYNSDILSNNPNCLPACAYDPQMLENDKNCRPCEYNAEISASDAKCVAPKNPENPANPSENPAKNSSRFTPTAPNTAAQKAVVPLAPNTGK